MHLRSITLRGFKSFADRTTLNIEPGLMGIVGPNGAGKSNLIDALMWSLGTLSTRTLRADRMEDVIFMGTEGRKTLGMAQVTITFDNADGTFPLDFSEIQIGRTLYRDGASEYSINGTQCRLLDVQELLAEAGLGRELHAVVAQGQVDDIVQSKPTELRAYIEEAAGISKHRRRKERALRRIDQVSLDIDRAADVAGELRRQLRPLRAQAEQARRHTEITDRLREIHIRRLVGELEGLERERARAMEGRESASAQLGDLRSRLESLRSGRLEADRRLDSARRASSGMRKGLEHLRSAQASTLRAAIVLRERAHAQPDIRRRDAIVSKQQELDADEAEVRSALEEVSGELGERERQVAGSQQRRGQLRLALATDGERLTQVRGELTTIEAESRAAEQAEITARAEGRASSERAERANAEIARLGDQAQVVHKEIEDLDTAEGRASMTVERLETEQREAATALDEADRKLRSLESEKTVLEGRAETLRVAQDLASHRRKGAETLRSTHGAELDARGVLGELIKVPTGYERTVEAVLGPLLDALVVSGSKVADAVAFAEVEMADLLIVPTLPGGERPSDVGGARPLAVIIDAPAWLRGTIDALCDGTYVVESPEEARVLSARHPDETFVARSGRVLRAKGPSRPAPSGEAAALAMHTAMERAEQGLRRVESERNRWTQNADRCKREVERIDRELRGARSELAEIEGRIAAAADRLREIGAAERATSLERDLAERDRDDRLRRAEQAALTQNQLAARRQELASNLESVSTALAESQRSLDEIEMGLSAGDVSRTELLTRKASLEERLRGIGRTRSELAEERVDVETGPTDPEDLRTAEQNLQALDAFVTAAEAKVRELLEGEEAVEVDLRGKSEETSRVEVQVASIEPRSLLASEELARLDVRLEEIGSRLAHEFEIPPSRAREEFPPAGEDEALHEEERRLDRELRRMGPVNPLAVREISTLDERREFLETQLEDLRSSRRDLLKVVRAADVEMRELLVRAAEDANNSFQDVIGLLFPEGGGRIRLTGSDDPLEAGIEIEVRLGRKGHRRLSFLSGGEKALAGLAFLFALHLARPTPFMVLDEVDAPLDDANLGRFLRLLDSLRSRTQVVVITHQKRTMERSDTLIGVTLNPDGTSRVITQRLQSHVEHVVANGVST
ncbi:MAG: chromosome segregation protein SMC [Actinomycetota bacterium]